MSRRHPRFGPLAFAISILLNTAPVVAGTLVLDATIVHDGITRYFDYYVPDGLPAAPVPLLFVLHGGTQSNKSLLVSAPVEFQAIADQEPFIIVRPNGTDPATGQSGANGAFNWNDCRADTGALGTTADDVGFIGALIDWAAASYQIDLDRVYSTGPSNGGLMSYRLAFELSDRIAAIGAVIANLPANSECPATPAHPVGVLIMNGTVDAFMPFNGGPVAGGGGVVQSAHETRDFWRTFLATGPAATHVNVPNINLTDASTVASDAYCNGAQGTAVMLYTVTGGGHTMPSIAHPVPPNFAFLGPQNRDMEGAQEIWRFLEQHRRNGCGPCEAWDAGAAACVAAPRTGCRKSTVPTTTKLQVTDKAEPERDRVSWKWSRGEATALADLGDPLASDDYALCVYDESSGSPTVMFRAVAPARQSLCGTAARWSGPTSSGFEYKDAGLTPDGMDSIRLKVGSVGKSKLIVRAAGANLSARSFAIPTPPLATPLRVQLHVEGGACFEATYSASGVLVNQPGRFKGRGDP